jgi:hypothetical protein
VVRTPEFSQCFGDKAALEELTDGMSVGGVAGGGGESWRGVVAARGAFASRIEGSAHARARLPCVIAHVSHILSLSPPPPPSLPPSLRTADLLTAIEFDHTGDYLATGDRGGRVVLFEKGDDIKQVCACKRGVVYWSVGCGMIGWMSGDVRIASSTGEGPHPSSFPAFVLSACRVTRLISSSFLPES